MLEETLQVLYGRLILELLNFTLSPGHTVPQLIVERSQPKEAQHDCKRSAWRDLGQQLTCMLEPSLFSWKQWIHNTVVQHVRELISQESRRGYGARR